PSQGWTQLCDDITIRIEVESDFRVDGQVVRFPALSEHDWVSAADAYTGIGKWKGTRIHNLGMAQYGSSWGGTVPFWALARHRLLPNLGHVPQDVGFTGREEYRSDAARRAYPFVSVPFVVRGNDESIEFGGAEIKVSIYTGNTHSQYPREPSEETLVQTFEFEFPATPLPIPILAKRLGKRIPNNFVDSFEAQGDPERPLDYDAQGRPRSSGSGVVFPSFYWSLNRGGCGVGDPEDDHANWGSWSRRGATQGHEKYRSQQYGRFYQWGIDWRTLFFQKAEGRNFRPGDGADVVRSLVPRHGDYRLIAARKEIGPEEFVPHRHYFEEDRYLVHHFTSTNSGRLHGFGLDKTSKPLVPELEDLDRISYQRARKPDFPQTESSEGIQLYGDFDNGVSITTDGAFINKPDEGNGRQWERRNGTVTVPYYDAGTQQILGGAAFFSPNRQLPSPVMFGSLPTGVKRNRPWETLLFRPQRDHPGQGDSRLDPNSPESFGRRLPPDHLLLDFFWMPVVEPYAISEPLSTAGKINLNYAMLPFSHITRATGIHAVMKSEQILVIPNEAAPFYKRHVLPKNHRWEFRFPIDVEETCRQFEELFDRGQLFLTGSEVCEVHLVPDREENSVQVEDMEQFWKDHALTGDNSRERPYANIYPRVTTKSNTYRIHYRSQVIRSGRGSNPGKFEPEQDVVVAETRGDCLVERYLDSADPDLIDYASGEEDMTPLGSLYRYRIISTRRFAP
ncbi:MAG: Verru_Chthon cassette protein A, partial [Verrucomicrobiota bacterium]